MPQSSGAKSRLKACLRVAFGISLLLSLGGGGQIGQCNADDRHVWIALNPYSAAEATTLAADFRSLAELDVFMLDRQWPYVLRLERQDSALLYFGSRHTRNLQDPQLSALGELWNSFEPTVAVTEHRLGPLVGSMELGISRFAEFGFLSTLAQRGGVPLHTLEPPWPIEVGEMTAAFPGEQVLLFYTLRAFLGERSNTPPSEIDTHTAHLLRRWGDQLGLATALPNLAALEELWNEKFSDLGPWRELPAEAIWPNAQPTRLQTLANRVNEIRDQHATGVILHLLEQGERVFALAGGSHVVVQEPALRNGWAIDDPCGSKKEIKAADTR